MDPTPRPIRSSVVSSGNTSASMSFSAKAGAYCSRPSPRSQSATSIDIASPSVLCEQYRSKPVAKIPMEATTLRVNGNAVSVAADGDTPLLDVLRNHLGLVGTKFGCGQEQCGCCMVLIDGRPEKSCGKALSTAAGKTI